MKGSQGKDVEACVYGGMLLTDRPAPNGLFSLLSYPAWDHLAQGWDFLQWAVPSHISNLNTVRQTCLQTSLMEIFSQMRFSLSSMNQVNKKNCNNNQTKELTNAEKLQMHTLQHPHFK